jgi:hypothetical protein
MPVNFVPLVRNDLFLYLDVRHRMHRWEHGWTMTGLHIYFNYDGSCTIWWPYNGSFRMTTMLESEYKIVADEGERCDGLSNVERV